MLQESSSESAPQLRRRSARAGAWVGPALLASAFIAIGGCEGASTGTPEPSTAEPSAEPEGVVDGGPPPLDAGPTIDGGGSDGGATGVDAGEEDAGIDPAVPALTFVQFEPSTFDANVLVVAVSGTDATEDVLSAVYTVRDANGDVLAGPQNIDFIFGDYAYDSGHFRAVFYLSRFDLGQTPASVDVRVGDGEGHFSNTRTAQFDLARDESARCLAGFFESVTPCREGARCDIAEREASPYVGECVATETAAPQLTAVELFAFYPDDFRCAFSYFGPNLAQVNIVGSAEQAPLYLRFPQAPFSDDNRRHFLDGEHAAGTFQASVFICTSSQQAFDEVSGQAVVVDAASRESAPVAFTFGDIAPEAPAAYTCGETYANADGCHCGCGVPDPDCATASLDACTICNAEGSCSFSTCDVVGIDPNDVTQCENVACGADLELSLDIPLFSSTDLAPASMNTTCGQSAGPEVAMRVTTSATAASLTLTVESNGEADHVVEVRMACAEATTAIECVNAAGAEGTETLTFDVSPNTTYSIVVDSVSEAAAGSFRITATEDET